MSDDEYTNGTECTNARWLKMLADLAEEEAMRPTFSPLSTIAEIEAYCRANDCYVRVESIEGKPVAFPVKYTQADEIPAFLRVQAF